MIISANLLPLFNILLGIFWISFLSSIFIWELRINNVVINKILNFFIFILFSFGLIDDKIMNIIKIPPINNIRYNIGNQASPLSSVIAMNIKDLLINKIMLIFTGFQFKIMDEEVNIIVNFNNWIVIIFLSLFKNFSFGYWRFRRNWLFIIIVFF